MSAAVVVKDLLRTMGLVVVNVSGGGAGDPRNVWQTAGGCPCHRGTAAVQQELAVVDDSGASRGRAEQRSSWSCGVIVGQVRRVVYSHPSSWDCPARGLLTIGRHLQIYAGAQKSPSNK